MKKKVKKKNNKYKFSMNSMKRDEIKKKNLKMTETNLV
jgi:hypothetical protein